MIVIGHEPVDPDSGFPWRFVGMRINIFIFYGSPQPLHEDIVISPASMIHADLCSGIQEDPGELRAGEMASLVAVHDLRCGYLQSLPAGIQDETNLHTVAEVPVEHIPGEPVDDCHQIEPVGFDWDICYVNRPYMIRMVNG